MQPDKISQNFNKASEDYELFSGIQYQSAQELIDIYLKAYPDLRVKSILDIGCGTGYIPQLLLNHFPDATYYLNDIADNMMTHCQKKFQSSEFHYLKGDMDHLDFPKVDLMTSNFSLQWSKDMFAMIDNMFLHSKKMAMTCLIEGTFATWYRLLKSPSLIPYPSVASIQSRLMTLDPKAKVFIKSYTLNFEHPRAFLKYINRLGASYSEIKIPLSTLKYVMQSKKPFQTQYQVLFAILERK